MNASFRIIVLAFAFAGFWLSTSGIPNARAEQAAVDNPAEDSASNAEVSEEPGPTQEQTREAAGRYQEGVEAYKHGRYKDAIRLFLEADQLAPSPALSFNIARAYDKIFDTAGSLRFYRDYLRRLPDAEDAESVGELIRQREAQLEQQGVQQLTIITTPAGATVVIDERAMGVSPWTGELAPGVVRLSLRRRGYADTDRTIELAADRAMDVVVRLVPGSSADLPPPSAGPLQSQPEPSRPERSPPTSPAVTHDSGSPMGVWPWVTLGVGAATLGAAGTFEILRRGAEEEARSAETQVEYLDRFSEMTRHKKTARWLLGVGGGVLVVSGVLFYLDLQSSDAELSAGCSPAGCEMRYEGVF